MGAEMKTVGHIILIEAKAMQDKTSEAMSYGHTNETDSEMLLRRGRATLFERYEEAEQALKETLLAATAQNSKWPEKFKYKIVPVEVTAPQPKPEQELVAWRNAAIRVGEDLCSVGPFGYYDMTAKQWLDWALSVVTVHAPPPQRTWVGLTDEERDHLEGLHLYAARNQVEAWIEGVPAFIDAIEAKLREKNG